MMPVPVAAPYSSGQGLVQPLVIRYEEIHLLTSPQAEQLTLPVDSLALQPGHTHDVPARCHLVS
jgi:hypothetical protein